MAQNGAEIKDSEVNTFINFVRFAKFCIRKWIL